MFNDITSKAIIKAMEELNQQGFNEVPSKQLLEIIGVSSATLKRYLAKLTKSGQLLRVGTFNLIRYQLPNAIPIIANSELPQSGARSKALKHTLSLPLGQRTPVTYQRNFVDQYIPNETFLLGKILAQDLFKKGKIPGQYPAGTYARKVLEQLLIDLSWSSSRLEGNRFSLLATEELFKNGIVNGDRDSIMLLNHKKAIEFLIDAVPEFGFSHPVFRNLHALLMQDLMDDPAGLGEIRKKIVNISDTIYTPNQIPSYLLEMFQKIIELAKQIKNPIEAAFFLWVNIAYLQPFEDGNKRTSRLSANIPLLLYNCAPLSFMNVDPQEYAYAMLGIYEKLDVSLALELFESTYLRSIQKYSVIIESMGGPDPLRLKHRENFNFAIQQIVRNNQLISQVAKEIGLTPQEWDEFLPLLILELKLLSIYNCARYGLSIAVVEKWKNKKIPVKESW